MRNIKYIFVHCTAGPQTQTVEQIQNTLGSMYLSRNDIQRLREILQVRENRLDTNRESFLSEEEEKHLHKYTENGADSGY